MPSIDPEFSVVEEFGNVEKYQQRPQRSLHYFFLVDTSGSMGGEKIAQLNAAMDTLLPILKDAIKSGNVENNFNIVGDIRVIRFATGADWYIGDAANPVPLDGFVWTPLTVGGVTHTASAIEHLLEGLSREYMGNQNIPPVCILISDGECTEALEKYNAVIEKMNKSGWGKRAIRAAIAIGNDYNEVELAKFAGPAGAVFQVTEINRIGDLIKFVSQQVTRSATSSRSTNISTPSNKYHDSIVPASNIGDGVVVKDASVILKNAGFPDFIE